eukprot:SAG11_NODE_13878_length_635_cov_0.742537_3_plen_26_part_01
MGVTHNCVTHREHAHYTGVDSPDLMI